MVVVDLVAACRVFVYVAERGSFTLGAAAARVPQSVASRRVAALERHLGARLFDRSARRAALTAFGRDMMPSARHLVRLAETMEYEAERLRLRPMTVAVPDTSVRRLAELEAAARRRDIVLDFRVAGPIDRAELVRGREVRIALLAVPADEASWVVPLGVASATGTGGAGPVPIETLRPARTQHSYRRVWIQPEDDVPGVRDRLRQLGHRAALAPGQVVVAASLPAAVSAAIRGDLLLCSAAQAGELELSWRPLAGAPVARGYGVAAADGGDARQVRDALHDEVARCLGVPG